MIRIFFIALFIFSLGYQSVLAIEPTAEEVKVETATPASSLDKAETKLKDILGPIYTSLEVFRNKQAEHFAVVRDKTKIKLGINLASDALEKIKPFLAPLPAPSAIPGDNPQEELEIKKLDNPTDYGVLIGSTALATLFASVWMFYTVLILLIFLVIRTLFRMIV